VDHDRFDTLARALAGGATRRALLGFASVSGLGMLGLAALPGADDAAAKKGGKNNKQKRRRRRCKLSNLRGKSCSADKACCPSKKNICGIPFGGAETDPKECCGALGAPCEFPSDCCAEFTCPSGGGACEFAKM
jgi:hypothetical protein